MFSKLLAYCSCARTLLNTESIIRGVYIMIAFIAHISAIQKGRVVEVLDMPFCGHLWLAEKKFDAQGVPQSRRANIPRSSMTPTLPSFPRAQQAQISDCSRLLEDTAY